MAIFMFMQFSNIAFLLRPKPVVMLITFCVNDNFKNFFLSQQWKKSILQL